MPTRKSHPSNRSARLRRSATVWLLCLTAGIGASARADSFIYVPHQAAAQAPQPNTADDVEQNGADAGSASFPADALPNTNRPTNDNPPAIRSIRTGDKPRSPVASDPARLESRTVSNAYFCFVGTIAGYDNSHGFDAIGGDATNVNPLLLFLHATGPTRDPNSSRLHDRTASEPLFPGDFLECKHFNAGTILNLFMISDATQCARSEQDANNRLDPDFTEHALVFDRAANSSPLFGSDETCEGGNRDLNDALFAADVCNQSSASLIHFVSLNEASAPKPTRILAWVRERNPQRSAACESRTGSTFRRIAPHLDSSGRVALDRGDNRPFRPSVASAHVTVTRAQVGEITADLKSKQEPAEFDLPQAFSVRDEDEFSPVQHLLARLYPKLSVKEVATGVHVNENETLHWGLVYLDSKPPSEQQIESALRKAGFDFAHNVPPRTYATSADSGKTR